MLFLPPVQHLVPLATGEILLPARHDRTIPAIVIVCVTVLLLITGQNTLSTYIVPWLTEVGTVPPGCGQRGPARQWRGRRRSGWSSAGLVGDRWPRAALALMLAGVVVGVAALAVFGPGSVPATIVGGIAWGVFFGGIPSLIQARMLQSASLRIRDTASAWLTIAFNSRDRRRRARGRRRARPARRDGACRGCSSRASRWPSHGCSRPTGVRVRAAAHP